MPDPETSDVRHETLSETLARRLVRVGGKLVEFACHRLRLLNLDERRRRIYLASEAAALGHGGITLVAAASGVSAATIAPGTAELSERPLPAGRIRAPGAGRKPLTVTAPGLLPALEALIEPHTRGDPVSPLRWTMLSLRSLASGLTIQGHSGSATAVGRLLHALGCSLQDTAKTHPWLRVQVKRHEKP